MRPADTEVLVVGAGPAGMECAVTLGRRGFEAVHLVEAEPDVGGRMRWVRRVPTLGDWGRIVDHRKVMLSKLRNVEVITGRRLSADDVRDYGGDFLGGLRTRHLPRVRAAMTRNATVEIVTGTFM